MGASRVGCLPVILAALHLGVTVVGADRDPSLSSFTPPSPPSHPPPARPEARRRLGHGSGHPFRRIPDAPAGDIYACNNQNHFFCPESSGSGPECLSNEEKCHGSNEESGNDGVFDCNDDDSMEDVNWMHRHRTWLANAQDSGESSADPSKRHKTLGQRCMSLTEHARFCKQWMGDIFAYCPLLQQCVEYNNENHACAHSDSDDPCCACTTDYEEMTLTFDAPGYKALPTDTIWIPSDAKVCRTREQTTTWEPGEDIPVENARVYNCESYGIYRLDAPPDRRFSYEENSNGNQERQIADISSFPWRLPWFLRWKDCAAATTGFILTEETTDWTRPPRAVSVSPTWPGSDKYFTMVHVGKVITPLVAADSSFSWGQDDYLTKEHFYPKFCEPNGEGNCGTSFDPPQLHPEKSLIIRGQVNPRTGSMSVIDGENMGTLFQVAIGGFRLELSNVWLRRGRGWCGGAVMLDSPRLAQTTTAAETRKMMASIFVLRNAVISDMKVPPDSWFTAQSTASADALAEATDDDKWWHHSMMNNKCVFCSWWWLVSLFVTDFFFPPPFFPLSSLSTDTPTGKREWVARSAWVPA